VVGLGLGGRRAHWLDCVFEHAQGTIIHHQRIFYMAHDTESEQNKKRPEVRLKSDVYFMGHKLPNKKSEFWGLPFTFLVFLAIFAVILFFGFLRWAFK
jgi:hypothetical protein